ncbi:MAG: ABC transporter substrate-binding protein [Cyanobacteriota bacterium]
MRRIKFINVAIIIVLILLCAGCGSNRPSDTKVLKVGINSTAPPYGFYDENTNELSGFDVDIARELARRTNKELVIEEYSFQRILYSVLNNRIDCGFGSTYITEERKEKLGFTEPYNIDVTKIAIHASHKDINTLDDLKKSNIKIASKNGTIYAQILKEIGFSDNQIVIYPEQADLKLIIQKDHNMGVATGHRRLSYLVQNKILDLKFIDPPIVPPQYCGITVNKNNTELIDRLNIALKEMKEDGTYKKIAMKWFKHDPFEEYSLTK